MAGRINGDVGRNRPPKKWQFRPGRSGNPLGRPKGSRNLKTDLADELAERIPIRENGKTRRISKQRAMIKGAVARAIQGDQRALSNLLSLVLKVMGEEIKDNTNAGLTDDQKLVLRHFKERLRAEVIADLADEKEDGSE
jgi:hypothetical protein